MNLLSNLRSLLWKLKKDEVKTLLLFLDFQIPAANRPSKSAQLTSILLDENTYSTNDIQKTIYGKPNPTAFYKLVSRLKEKVYEVLLLDQHINEVSYTLRNKVIFGLKKRLLISELLFNRGATEELENRLKEIVRDAKDYEIYDVLSQALNVLRRLYIVRKRKKLVDETSTEIAFYKKAEFLVDNANSEFSRMMNRINFSFDTREYYSDLLILVSKLNEWYKETKSASIGYSYYLLSVEQFQTQGDYKNSDRCLVELGKMLEEKPVFSTKNRLGTWRLNYASNLLHLKLYNEAYLNSQMAYNLFQGVALNEILSLEVMFYSRYYNDEFAESEKVLLKAMSKLKGVDAIVNERFKFYSAVLLFVNGDYKQAEAELNALHDLKKDKEGWNVMRKIYLLLCKIELGEYDYVDLQTQSLHKYIKRINSLKFINPRYIIILRILSKLANLGFDYNFTYKSRKKYFDLLDGEDSQLAWKVKSPELINFTDWFKKKLK